MAYLNILQGSILYDFRCCFHTRIGRKGGEKGGWAAVGLLTSAHPHRKQVSQRFSLKEEGLQNVVMQALLFSMKKDTRSMQLPTVKPSWVPGSPLAAGQQAGCPRLPRPHALPALRVHGFVAAARQEQSSQQGQGQGQCQAAAELRQQWQGQCQLPQQWQGQAAPEPP